MSKLIEKWKSITPVTKWWTLIFIQVWTWPQLFEVKLPANIAVPLFITMVACFIFNVTKLITAYDHD